MFRIIKWLLILAILGFFGVAGYAYFGDLSQPATDVTRQVTIEVD